MFVVHTGKVIAYRTRNKKRSMCDIARRFKKTVKKHNCRQNWTGSAKSVEADMVVSMTKKKNKKKHNNNLKTTKSAVKTIVGDDDTSTISRLKYEVDPAIGKVSDSYHVKRNRGNELYKLKAKFTLSYQTIKYLQRLFSYMCRQNKDNLEGIKQSLDALSRHPFSDHSACDSDWFRHIDDPNSKFSSMAFGKPLNNKNLQD